MEKLKEALIQFTHSNPSLFPNDAADNSYPLLIEHCFPKFFKDFQTPNHPPYAAMIYKAIQELNKKGGSSEKSISDHIQKEYTDLPLAHSTLLKHHLEKLCDRKEICITDKQRYLLAGVESESRNKSSKPSKKHKKQKSQPNSEASKKSSRPHKKYKKKEKNPSGVQKTSDKEHIGLIKRMRNLGLKSIKKNSKRAKKHSINNEVTVDESHEQKQTSEVTMGDIQIQEQSGLRKRKHGLKSKRKSSKRTKKHAINEDTKLQLLGEANLEQNNEVIDEVPLDDKPKYKRRGRPPKGMQPEKSKFKSQQLAKKCKAGKKNGQPKNKGHVKHKMTRRSSREPSSLAKRDRILSLM